jgi:putative oxidoreductase
MNNMFDKVVAKDEILLIARVLMMLLFVLFGWQKLIGFGSTAATFASMGLPLPTLATCIAVGAELGLGMAIVLGFLTRPIAPLLAVYTLATGFIGHPFWNMSGAAQTGAEINFYKNVAIVGGLLLLYLTGAGKYSFDAMVLRQTRPA